MKNIRITALLGAGLLGLVVACGPAAEVTITSTRPLSTDANRAQPGASSALRFTGRGGVEADHNHADEQAAPFAYQVPEGWKELAASSQRMINLQPAGQPDASCYLTILGGEAGGLLANANRWLGQLGLEPLDAEGVAALPKVTLLGQPATLVEGFGHFTGMGDQAQDDFGLLGLIQTIHMPGANGDQAYTVFVKMTAPRAVVEAEREAFAAFCASLSPMKSGASTAGQEPVTSSAGGKGPLAYSAPSGWVDQGPSGMRLASFKIGATAECSVIRLNGDGGGLVGNVNRWRGQLGLDPLDAAGIASLPTVSCLGSEATLFDGTGAYTGMSDEAMAEARMLGALVFLPDSSFFIKLVGSAAEVGPEVENFKTFVTSLELGS